MNVAHIEAMAPFQAVQIPPTERLARIYDDGPTADLRDGPDQLGEAGGMRTGETPGPNVPEPPEEQPLRSLETRPPLQLSEGISPPDLRNDPGPKGAGPDILPAGTGLRVALSASQDPHQLSGRLDGRLVPQEDIDQGRTASAAAGDVDETRGRIRRGRSGRGRVGHSPLPDQ